MQDGIVNNLRRPVGTRPGDRFGRKSNTRDRGSDRGGRGGNLLRNPGITRLQ